MQQAWALHRPVMQWLLIIAARLLLAELLDVTIGAAVMVVLCD